MPLSRTRDKARKRVYRAGQKEYRAVVKAAVVEQLTAAVEKRGITVEDLLDEWVRIGTGEVTEPLTWVAKTKALSELSSRLWPVPREPEQPKAITVRVIYEDEKGKSGIEVKVE